MVNSNVTVTSSRFEGGQATVGGALFFSCESASVCQCHISQTNFSGHSALEGGAVYWTKVRPSYFSILAVKNTAVYGPFEASLPTNVSLISARQATLYGVAGINVIYPILIGFFDEIGQLVTTDNSSSTELESEHIIGTTSLIAQGGIANFSSILLHAYPGDSVQIQVQSRSINDTFPHSAGAHYSFVYVTRLCVPGEVTTALGCYLCPKNTFSVDPEDTKCTECPGYATCPGGKALVLKAGYWRESDLSADVLQCPIAEACEGGENATCAAGYEAVSCARCSEDHYFTGFQHCERCEMLSVRLFRASLISVAAAGLYIAFVALPCGLWLSSLRVVVEFFQMVLILPSLSVNWSPLLMGYFSFNEMLMSGGLSALTLDCWVRGSAFLPAAFIKSLAATAFAILVLILLAAVCYLLRRNGRFLPKYVRCSCVFLWLFHPYMVKSSLSLLSCKKVNGTWLLAADVSVSCYAEEQRLLLVMALPLTLLSVFPFPLLFWKSLRRGPAFRQKYVPLYLFAAHRLESISVSARTVLWRVVLFAMLLGLIPAGCILQTLCCTTTLYLSLHMHIAAPQYTSPFLTVSEGVSQLIQIYLCASSLYLAVELEVHPTIQTIISGVSFILTIVFAVGTCTLGLRLQRHQTVYPLDPESGASVTPPPSLASGQSFSSISLKAPCTSLPQITS